MQHKYMYRLNWSINLDKMNLALFVSSLRSSSSKLHLFAHLLSWFELKLAFPMGRDSATFQDKGTEVPSLSQDKGTTGRGTKRDRAEKDILKQEKDVLKQKRML